MGFTDVMGGKTYKLMHSGTVPKQHLQTIADALGIRKNKLVGSKIHIIRKVKRKKPTRAGT
jgi:hypothetical protein